MFKKTVLDNGIRLLTEKLPSHTVSVGVWVEVGSRDEDARNNGSSHFVEHMFFKGTQSRSAQDLAHQFDMLGGMSNAFTSNENTCFHATVLDDKLAQVVDILADILLHSIFDQTELSREREVILQEISMVEDTPDDRIHEMFSSQLFGEHPLGQTVLGRPEVVSALDSKTLREYVAKHYLPERIVIAAAGNVEHERFCALWQEKLDDFAGPSASSVREVPQTLAPYCRSVEKSLEQMHMIVGTYGLPATADERYALYLLNIILGGNMSSRLFQEIRERHGLAYSVYSYLASLSDCGYLAIYLGVDPGSVNSALSLLGKELAAIRSSLVSEAELSMAKDYAKAGLYLAGENTEARMTRIARNELSFGRYISLDEVVEGFTKVDRQDLMDLAGQLFDTELFGVSIGPLTGDDLDWSPLKTV